MARYGLRSLESMRNIFHQYKHAENKLTHAFVSSLACEPALLKAFCTKFVNAKIDFSEAKVLEQSIPGIEVTSEDEAERKGLPDALIYSDEEFAIVIESKINARLTTDQLQRHTRTLKRHGFKEVAGIAITVNKATTTLPPEWINILWCDVYIFLQRFSSIWSKTAAEYFCLLEEEMISDENFTEGSLTTFTGIPFDKNDAYNYIEAKRLIRLLMVKVRADKAAVKKLSIDESAKGRSAITNQEHVWDYLQFHDLHYGADFTHSPHMTAGFSASYADAQITFPNNLRGELRQKINDSSFEEFHESIKHVIEFYESMFDGFKGVKPIIKVVQRHYKSQRSKPTKDAEMVVDLRTAYKSKDQRSIKYQPEWLQSVHSILLNKQSNVQLQIGCQFFYEECSLIKDENAHQAFVNAWIGARHFITALK